MNLGFFAADTLGVTLYQIRSQLKASEVHQIKLGPWRIELPMDVESDIMHGHELGFWVTLNKVLRCYVIIREKENWLFVLNADALKACGAATGFAGLTLKTRVEEIKPAIKGVFRWKNAGQPSWEKVQFTEVH